MLINVTQALGEMAIVYPVSGGFYTLAVRFLDPSWGFAMVSPSLSSVLTFPIGSNLTHSIRSYRVGTTSSNGLPFYLLRSLLPPSPCNIGRRA
jgi:amino acid permease